MNGIGRGPLRSHAVLATAFSIPLRGTFVSLMAAHVQLVTRYMLVVMHGRPIAVWSMLKEATAGLGERPFTTFRRITLPLLKPAFVAGGSLSFLVSFDNVLISLFLAGPGASPFPVALFEVNETSVSPTVNAAATVAPVVSIVTTLIVEHYVGLRTVLIR